jgi:hypothetical protein
MRVVLIAVTFVSFAASAAADPPTSRPAEPPSAEELASIMKALLTPALPDPLVEQSSNWGHQSAVMNGVTWEKDGILRKPHKQKKLKNDGTWRRIKVEAVDQDKNLNLVVRNVQQLEKGRLTFDLVLTLQTRIYFEQQIWKSGVRLYSGSTRARCRPILSLKCESASRTVKTDGALPDVVFRLRVLDAKLTYDQFKVEHTAGVGGELAEVLGDAIHDMVKQLKPSLERDMLEKANRAIVKAGDTKEVKLGLGRLFDGK